VHVHWKEDGHRCEMFVSANWITFGLREVSRD
jgi:hypothetical protein